MPAKRRGSNKPSKTGTKAGVKAKKTKNKSAKKEKKASQTKKRAEVMHLAGAHMTSRAEFERQERRAERPLRVAGAGRGQLPQPQVEVAKGGARCVRRRRGQQLAVGVARDGAGRDVGAGAGVGRRVIDLPRALLGGVEAPEGDRDLGFGRIVVSEIRGTGYVHESGVK